VDDRLLSVSMAVRLARRTVGSVCMLMVLVVSMRMLVLQRLVRVLVLVSLGPVEQHGDRHQGSAGE
jgi:hypothetical protein